MILQVAKTEKRKQLSLRIQTILGNISHWPEEPSGTKSFQNLAVLVVLIKQPGTRSSVLLLPTGCESSPLKVMAHV